MTKTHKPKAATSKAAAAPTLAKPIRASQINAAFTVLSSAKAPLSTREMVATMTERKLWNSPNGKTPHATLYAAIFREIKIKGTKSRFVQTAPGRFTIHTK